MGRGACIIHGEASLFKLTDRRKKQHTRCEYCLQGAITPLAYDCWLGADDIWQNGGKAITTSRWLWRLIKMGVNKLLTVEIEGQVLSRCQWMTSNYLKSPPSLKSKSIIALIIDSVSAMLLCLIESKQTHVVLIISYISSKWPYYIRKTSAFIFEIYLFPLSSFGLTNQSRLRLGRKTIT